LVFKALKIQVSNLELLTVSLLISIHN